LYSGLGGDDGAAVEVDGSNVGRVFCRAVGKFEDERVGSTAGRVIARFAAASFQLRMAFDGDDFAESDCQAVILQCDLFIVGPAVRSGFQASANVQAAVI
jgi:hypothetical protein